MRKNIGALVSLFFIAAIIGLLYFVTFHGQSFNFDSPTLTEKKEVKTGNYYDFGSDVTISVDNSKIVTINGGRIDFINPGKVTVTIIDKNNIKKEYVFIVKEKEEKPEVEIEKITLNKTSVTLTEGQSIKLTATISPSNAKDKKIVWQTNDSSIVTVNNGSVKAIKEGTATITVMSANGISASCEIIVIHRSSPTYPVTSVTLEKKATTIKLGRDETIGATILPNNATNKTLKWSSSNTSIATVNQLGKIVGVKEGKATITAEAHNGVKGSIEVTIINDGGTFYPVTSINLNKTSTEIYVGNSETITATLLPSNASDKSIVWSSSDTTVATVSNGKITAVKAGITVITAKSHNGKKATCTVTVKKVNQNIPVTGVSLNKSKLTLNEGASESLIATISPGNATDKTLTWTSSNTSVATVASGKVTAVKEGTTTITVKSNNGKTATCTVTVRAKPTEDANTKLCNELKSKNASSIGYKQFIAINKIKDTAYDKYDDYYGIKAAHECANRLKLPVVAEKDTYHIYKAKKLDPIPVETSTNLNGSTFFIHDEKKAVSKGSGHIYYITGQKSIKLNITKLPLSQKEIPELKSYPNVFLLVENSNKKQFIRFGSNANKGANQKDFMIVKNGIIQSDRLWDMPVVTHAVAYIISNETLTFKNGVFYNIVGTSNNKPEGSNYLSRNIYVHRSNTTIDSIEHYNVKSIKKTDEAKSIPYGYSAFIGFYRAADLKVNNCILTPMKNSGPDANSTYELGANTVANIQITNVRVKDEERLTGDYWGATGLNYVKDIVYNKCYLNRYDTNKGVNNMTIKNSTGGKHGVTIVGGGDLTISNSKFIYIKSIVNLRKDYGSTFNGKITLTNVSVTPRNGAKEVAAVSISTSYDSKNKIHDFGYDLYIPSVTINGLTIKPNRTNYLTNGSTYVTKFNIISLTDSHVDSASNVSKLNDYTGGNFTYHTKATLKYDDVTLSNGKSISVSKYSFIKK